MADDDLLIPKGTPLSADELSDRLNLDMYEGSINDLTRIQISSDLDKAQNESGVSQFMKDAMGAKRNGRGA